MANFGPLPPINLQTQQTPQTGLFKPFSPIGTAAKTLAGIPGRVRQIQGQRLQSQLGQQKFRMGTLNEAQETLVLANSIRQSKPLAEGHPLIASFPELKGFTIGEIKGIIPSLVKIKKAERSTAPVPVVDNTTGEVLFHIPKNSKFQPSIGTTIPVIDPITGRLQFQVPKGTKFSPNKPLPIEVVRQLTNADDVLASLDDMDDFMKKDLSILAKAALPDIAHSIFRNANEVREFAFGRKNVSDILLRLRSGAQINEREYDRLLQLFPSASDWAASKTSGKSEFIFRKTQLFRRSFNNLIKAMQVGRPAFKEDGKTPWGDRTTSGEQTRSLGSTSVKDLQSMSNQELIQLLQGGK